MRSPSRSHSRSSSYSCLDNVVACPLCATTYAWWFRVQKTATVPQLKCSDTVSCFFFLGPVHRYRAGGRVHRDTVPIVRCIYCWVWKNTLVKLHVRTTTTTLPSPPTPPLLPSPLPLPTPPHPPPPPSWYWCSSWMAVKKMLLCDGRCRRWSRQYRKLWRFRGCCSRGCSFPGMGSCGDSGASCCTCCAELDF